MLGVVFSTWICCDKLKVPGLKKGGDVRVSPHATATRPVAGILISHNTVGIKLGSLTLHSYSDSDRHFSPRRFENVVVHDWAYRRTGTGSMEEPWMLDDEVVRVMPRVRDQTTKTGVRLRHSRSLVEGKKQGWLTGTNHTVDPHPSFV